MSDEGTDSNTQIKPEPKPETDRYIKEDASKKETRKMVE